MHRILHVTASLALLAACADDPLYFDFEDTGPTRDAGGDAADVGSDTAADVTTDTPADSGEDAVDPPPTSELVDPGCLDGQYTETLPPADADISGLVDSYDSDNYREFIFAVLDARYPVGAYLVNGAIENSGMGDCIEFFVRGTSSASEIFGQLSTFVHECGHFWDIAEGGFSDSTFIYTPDLWLSCEQGDTTARGGVTFARSLLNGDDYSELRPPCSGGGFGDGCDSYADIYLDGDPFDANFDGGDQGFNSVIEEATQYVNSIATGYAFSDQVRGSVSERDGILTFLWWIERYLRLARLEYPDAHEALLDDACWREAILTVWGRGWMYLDATEGMGNLGIDDAAILDLVQDPELVGEIQRVRDAEGCE